ncbi:MAG: hypothetical protein WC003_01610 [Terrimicrobiaceae bacterium]
MKSAGRRIGWGIRNGTLPRATSSIIHHPSSFASAFSLVEVVLAIGVLAFAITAMMGLLTVAMQSDKSSSSDTSLAAMSRQVFNSLKAMPYSNLTTLTNGTNYYFDRDGSECPPSGAVYECAVKLTPDVNDAQRVQMTFKWPYGAAAGTTNILQAGIANYGY